MGADSGRSRAEAGGMAWPITARAANPSWLRTPNDNTLTRTSSSSSSLCLLLPTITQQHHLHQPLEPILPPQLVQREIRCSSHPPRPVKHRRRDPANPVSPSPASQRPPSQHDAPLFKSSFLAPSSESHPHLHPFARSVNPDRPLIAPTPSSRPALTHHVRVSQESSLL